MVFHAIVARIVSIIKTIPTWDTLYMNNLTTATQKHFLPVVPIVQRPPPPPALHQTTSIDWTTTPTAPSRTPSRNHHRHFRSNRHTGTGTTANHPPTAYKTWLAPAAVAINETSGTAAAQRGRRGVALYQCYTEENLPFFWGDSMHVVHVELIRSLVVFGGGLVW